MMINQDWIYAENSFSKNFSEIKNFPNWQRYSWTEGEDYAKFNFIRLLDPSMNEAQFKKLEKDNISFFKKIKKTFAIKLPSSIFLSTPPFLNNYKIKGEPIVSMTIKSSNIQKLELPSDVRIYLCQSAHELDQWWQVNSDGRSDKFLQPLFPKIKNMFRDPDHRFYLLNFKNHPVSCGFFSTFKLSNGKISTNLAGLATRKKYQGNGFMKLLISEITKNIHDKIYLQTNLNSFAHNYFSSIPQSNTLNIERRFALVV